MVAACAAGSSWQPVPGAAADAAEQGDGPTIVFANDSGNSACPWLALANTLTGAGHRTVVLTYSTTAAAGESQALRELLDVANRSSGGGPYALVGAFLGGRLVIEAAPTRPPHLAVIVSLSGERTVEDYRDIVPDARRVTAPCLYVGSSDDPLTAGSRQPRQLQAALHGRPRQLLLLPGTAHGTDLLDAGLSGGTTVAERITTFVDQQLP